jgi:hypothetical protein
MSVDKNRPHSRLVGMIDNLSDCVDQLTRSLRRLRHATAKLVFVLLGYVIFLGLVAREIHRYLQ